ncbi:MAG: hypothetical protein P8168_00925 [Deltaproteobacteria bacterium]
MTTEASQTPWGFIHLDQYSRPAEPSREAVRQGIFNLWRYLDWRRKTEESVFIDKELSQVPQELLEKAAPEPDWGAALEAVTAVLDTWLDAEVPGSMVQIFVGPPYHGTAEILTAWAQARGWRLVSAPAPEMILSGGEEWLAQMEEGAEPLVLPHLEHCYLRHYDGLTLLRRLLDRIFSHQRRWLVGCDSWAWAYLSKALEVDGVFPPPFILAAFDQDRLKLWFKQLAGQAGEGKFAFRQADNGKYVLPRALQETPGDQNSAANQDISDFLKYVAAYSLGIPGIAWAAWRRSLSFIVTREEHAALNDRKVAELEDGDRAYPIWVKPWSQLNLPKFPGQRALLPVLMVLHALLIHGGLWSQVLSELLPLPPIEIMEHLYFLKAAEMVESDQGFWRVSPLGYPALRQVLMSEGYLTDGL